jgi:hypothetical protein
LHNVSSLNNRGAAWSVELFWEGDLNIASLLSKHIANENHTLIQDNGSAELHSHDSCCSGKLDWI